jgi:hypothetical protein
MSALTLAPWWAAYLAIESFVRPSDATSHIDFDLNDFRNVLFTRTGYASTYRMSFDNSAEANRFIVNVCRVATDQGAFSCFVAIVGLPPNLRLSMLPNATTWRPCRQLFSVIAPECDKAEVVAITIVAVGMSRTDLTNFARR